MQLIRGVAGLRGRSPGCAVTIGTYDGIHLGHQALLARVTQHARRLGTKAVLLTFEPTPREYLVPADPPARLTSLRERWRILTPLGLDTLWLLRFGETLRNLCAEDFAQLLVRELAPSVVVVGHDFRFARHGEATAPVAGIFAVQVRGVADRARAGVASLGTRPTIGGTEALLEAHVFDFDGDLYGREIEVEFVARLRDEARFASLDALTAQMERDAADARRILNA